MPNTGNNFGRRPLIGITMDVVEGNQGRLKVDCSLAYAACVEKAGGMPVMLPPLVDQVEEHLHLCNGFVLTGGDDPKMEGFGVATHPQAKVIHPQRQTYELALLEALRRHQPDAPVLGVCLGMQLMALHAGGTLDQYLPDSLASHAMHKNGEHPVGPASGCGLIKAGTVWSNHRQAIDSPGTLTIAATSSDGVIEAVCEPARRYYVGVQWHPERTKSADLGQRILNDLVSSSSR